MILRLTPLLLLLLLATINPIIAADLVCADPPDNCRHCPIRSILFFKLWCNPQSLVKATHWFINKKYFVVRKDDAVPPEVTLECKEVGGANVWIAPDGETVETAECHRLCDDQLPDTTSIRRLNTPEITMNEISCGGNASEVVVIDKDGYMKKYKEPLFCDVTTGIWMSREKRPGEKRAVKRPVSQSSKVYCRAVDDKTAEPFIAQYEDEPLPPPHPDWLVPVLIAIGTIIVLALVVPLTVHVTKLRTRGLPAVYDVPRVKAWSEHWNVAEEPVEWSWKVVKDFIASWDSHTTEDKTKFIEKGYSELGYKSTMTQMLHIFEWMLETEENHHRIWRPMIVCLVRIKRLTTPPFSDSDLMFRFNSYVAYQGKKIIDRYGLFNKQFTDRKNDPHDEYLRYIGVYLMYLGNGARTKKMFEQMDAIFLRECMDMPGPVRMAMAASKITRDSEMFSFERVWDRLGQTRPDEDAGEWGNLQDQIFYALGFNLDEMPNDMLMDYMMKSKKITASNIVFWFRGANERGHYAHMPFIIKNASRLNSGRRMLIESDECYECLRAYCLFDRSVLGWATVEEFVAKNAVLAKRLNVPAFRRRAAHFNERYAANGELELDCFLSEPARVAEIEEADFVPAGKVTARAAT